MLVAAKRRRFGERISNNGTSNAKSMMFVTVMVWPNDQWMACFAAYPISWL
jgi:hypothetical protein